MTTEEIKMELNEAIAHMNHVRQAMQQFNGLIPTEVLDLYDIINHLSTEF